MRKAAARLAAVTGDGPLNYLKLPVREFYELNNEIAEAWKGKKRKR